MKAYPTTVNTYLAVGKTKNYQFGDKKSDSINMYDNVAFEKKYLHVDDFLRDFHPTIPSENLLKRIKEEFNKPAGKITFNPEGKKANQVFYFRNEIRDQED